MLALTIILIGALVINGTVHEKSFSLISFDTISKIKLIGSMSNNTDKSAIYIRNLNLSLKKAVKKSLNDRYNAFQQSSSRDFTKLQKFVLSQDESDLFEKIRLARKEYFEEIYLLRDNMNIKNKVGVANILTITIEPKYEKLMSAYDEMLSYEYGYYDKLCNRAKGRANSISVVAIILTLFALFIEFAILYDKHKKVPAKANTGTQN